jgi:hypothetical protein
VPLTIFHALFQMLKELQSFIQFCPRATWSISSNVIA